MYSKNDRKVYYVGIGASAGGLDALRKFFDYMPSDSDMAFIVVQHLAPDYESVMNELLTTHTAMEVIVAKEQMKIEPNKIYLNSPGKMLLIHNNMFIQRELKKENKPLLYINNFFQSLAESKGSRAIAIVLSGTGSDGSTGISFIKENGGMVMAQNEESAEFYGMPKNSIATGYVDYVMAVEQMPEKLIEYTRHPLIEDESATANESQLFAFNAIINLLKRYQGVDFSLYKENLVLRRIDRRTALSGKNSMNDYYDFLLESDKEKENLVKDLLIGVTSFFRDKEVFASLYERVIPNLPYSRGQVRIWSVACSTGEEAYSIAIYVLEYMRIHKITCELKVFATDIDKYSLDYASVGVYDISIANTIPLELLARYFDFVTGSYRIKDEVRRCVIFSKHDVLRDAPFSRLDLLVCRNLFIYLKTDVQRKLFGIFHRLLNAEGYLVLGASESVGQMEQAFLTINKKWNIYKKNTEYNNQDTFALVSVAEPIIEKKDELKTYNGFLRNNHSKFIEQILSEALPPTVIIDSSGQIIHYLNDLEKFMKCGIGRAGQIMGSLRGNLATFIGPMIRKINYGEETKLTESILGMEGFEEEKVTIIVSKAIYKGETYIAVQFDSIPVKEGSENECIMNHDDITELRIKELEESLGESEEKLREVVEQVETRNEELQSSYEEVISSNEELQSTNEELQSVNEELYTVNGEYQNKIKELMLSYSDFDNLLVNAEIGAVFLDSEMKIRRITPVIYSNTHLLVTDIGRPISHVVFMSEYTGLIDDIAWVAANHKLLERTITNKFGRIWMFRIQPYIEESSNINGIVITMFDITSRLEIVQYDMNTIANNIPSGILRFECEPPFRMVYANESLYKLFGMTNKEYETQEGKEYLDRMTEDIKKIVGQKAEQGQLWEWTMFHDEYNVRWKSNEMVWHRLSGNVVLESSGKKIFQAVVTDITEQKQLEEALACERELLSRTAEQLKHPFWEYSYAEGELHVIYHQDDKKKDFKILLEDLEKKITIYPEDINKYHQMLYQIQAGKESISCEFRFLYGKDGEYQDIKAEGSCIKNSRGIPYKIIGVVQCRKRENMV